MLGGGAPDDRDRAGGGELLRAAQLHLHHRRLFGLVASEAPARRTLAVLNETSAARLAKPDPRVDTGHCPFSPGGTSSAFTRQRRADRFRPVNLTHILAVTGLIPRPVSGVNLGDSIENSARFFWLVAKVRRTNAAVSTVALMLNSAPSLSATLAVRARWAAGLARQGSLSCQAATVATRLRMCWACRSSPEVRPRLHPRGGAHRERTRTASGCRGTSAQPQPQQHARGPPAITRNKRGEPTTRSCTHSR
ncbi:hypothetical protein FB157_15515 [Streptomyces sp. BK340]|nr:hypothetical protein FB157_15515 [Streptomyces sp. BK340]